MILDLALMLLVATQIIMESLPVSSSGHVLLLEKILGVSLPPGLDHLLHGPTIIIVMVYFFKDWFGLAKILFIALKALVAKRFSYGALRDSHKNVLKMFLYICRLVVIADGVTSVCYFLVKKLALVQSMPALLVGFVVTMGVLLCSKLFVGAPFDKAQDKLLAAARGEEQTLVCVSNHSARPEEPVGRLEGLEGFEGSNIHRTILLGLIQGIALFPGISRFATTVVGGQLLGMQPRRALQFSFLLFSPLMVAAFIFNGLPVIFANAGFLKPGGFVCLLATPVAYVFFAGACRLALTKRFWWFALYMLVPITIAICLI